MQQWVHDHPWIHDSALFEILRQLPEHYEVPWWEWDKAYRFKDAAAMELLKAQHREEHDVFIALQFIFELQW